VRALLVVFDLPLPELGLQLSQGGRSPAVRTPRLDSRGEAALQLLHDDTEDLLGQTPHLLPNAKLAYLIPFATLIAVAASFRAASTEATPVTILTTAFFMASYSAFAVELMGWAFMVFSITAFMPR